MKIVVKKCINYECLVRSRAFNHQPYRLYSMVSPCTYLFKFFNNKNEIINKRKAKHVKHTE